MRSHAKPHLPGGVPSNGAQKECLIWLIFVDLLTTLVISRPHGLRNCKGYILGGWRLVQSVLILSSLDHVHWCLRFHTDSGWLHDGRTALYLCGFSHDLPGALPPWKTGIILGTVGMCTYALHHPCSAPRHNRKSPGSPPGPPGTNGGLGWFRSCQGSVQLGWNNITVRSCKCEKKAPCSGYLLFGVPDMLEVRLVAPCDSGTRSLFYLRGLEPKRRPMYTSHVYYTCGIA